MSRRLFSELMIVCDLRVLGNNEVALKIVGEVHAEYLRLVKTTSLGVRA